MIGQVLANFPAVLWLVFDDNGAFVASYVRQDRAPAGAVQATKVQFLACQNGELLYINGAFVEVVNG